MQELTFSIPEDSSWRLVVDLEAERVLSRLRWEIGSPQHTLFGLLDRAQVVARDKGSDDILVSIVGNCDRQFVVHLTFSEVQSTSPDWPHAWEVEPDELAAVFLKEL